MKCNNLKEVLEINKVETIKKMILENQNFKNKVWDFYRKNDLKNGTDKDFNLFLKLEQILFNFGD